MPSSSQKQHDLMLAVSKDKELAEKLNISQKVAKEFIKKDEEEGLWQAEPDLSEFDVESVSLEDNAIAELIPGEVRSPAKEAPAFRMEDRFTVTSDQGGDG